MPRPPSARLAGLFEQVQSERLFQDSKIFPDLIPLARPGTILEQFQHAGAMDRAQLGAFVQTHFIRPTEADAPPCQPGQTLVGRIQDLWNIFVRSPEDEDPNGSLLQTGHAYVVPGGRFDEAYYWDSYFSLLGLVADGRKSEAAEIVLGFAALLDRIGHIPNGARSYYLGRSQPPLFYLMIELTNPFASEQEALRLLLKEHAFWMAGAEGLKPGEAHRRVVKLPDGSILNRYWDDLPGPRDESYLEDKSLAAGAGRPEALLYRDLRAAAESGWDFSSRWLSDFSDLGSIRTTSILPIDLNALLWGLEDNIKSRALILGETELSQTYASMAERRAGAIRSWLWDPKSGFHCDYDWAKGERLGEATAALATPLFVGLADYSESESAANVIQERLLRQGGLVATGVTTGQQWDAPNGWAPLQWMAILGLARYGQNALAETLADRWLAMVANVFAETGQFFEKYDVESGTAGGGGEYAPQNGFGWTNGVTRALMDWRGLDDKGLERVNTIYQPHRVEAQLTHG